MGRYELKIQSHRQKLSLVHHKSSQKLKMMFFEPIYLDIDLSNHKPFAKQIDPFQKFCKTHLLQTNCKPSRCKPVQKIPQFLYVNLPEYKPENVQVKINKNGSVELSASKDLVVDSGRNGQRRTTTHIEQTFNLPEYLRKENLLDQVSCKFDDGRLVFSYPEMPVGVKMQINMEEDMIDEKTVYDEKVGKEAINKPGESEEISKPIDLEIVKIVDADGHSEIDVE